MYNLERTGRTTWRLVERATDIVLVDHDTEWSGTKKEAVERQALHRGRHQSGASFRLYRTGDVFALRALKKDGSVGTVDTGANPHNLVRAIGGFVDKTRRIDGAGHPYLRITTGG